MTTGKSLESSGSPRRQVIITGYKEGGSQAAVRTFTGHEAFSMTLNQLGNKWVVTKVQAIFRVYRRKPDVRS